MSGLIGKKLGMTSIFDANGDNLVCTVIEVGPNVVTQVKNEETDGYLAIQLAFGDKKEKNTTKAMKGHFEAAGTTPKRVLSEFRSFRWNFEGEVKLGDEITVDQVFLEGDRIDIVGTSKGKGFQGVVKRHGFKGVGMATHGQHNRQRAPGSIGASSDPSRVYKGMRMHGQTGNRQVKTQNLLVVRILPEHNLILVQGAVPGPKNGFVRLYKNYLSV